MLTIRIENDNESATIIASNDDLITQILVHLPIKSLLRFKCVSKHWFSLISSPSFTRRHNRSLDVSALFLQTPAVRNCASKFEFLPLNDENSSIAQCSLTFVQDPAGIRILQSCNGLLLCCSSNIHQGEENKRNYYVYNPTTRNFTTLPKPGGPFYGSVVGVVLAFDPSQSPHYYRAICVRRYPKSPLHYVIDIFTSETRSWRPCSATGQMPFEEDQCFKFNHGVFCNGVIHWKSSTTNSLLCFEFETERVRKVAGPPITRIRYIGESRRNLYLFGIVQRADYVNKDYNVYEMRGDYSGWVLKYRVDLDALAFSCPEMKLHLYQFFNWYLFSVLCVFVAENDDDSFLVLHIPGKVVRYNVNDKSYKVLRDFEPYGSNLHECPLVYESYEFIQALAYV